MGDMIKELNTTHQDALELIEIAQGSAPVRDSKDYFKMAGNLWLALANAGLDDIDAITDKRHVQLYNDTVSLQELCYAVSNLERSKNPNLDKVKHPESKAKPDDLKKTAINQLARASAHLPQEAKSLATKYGVTAELNAKLEPASSGVRQVTRYSSGSSSSKSSDSDSRSSKSSSSSRSGNDSDDEMLKSVVRKSPAKKK